MGKGWPKKRFDSVQAERRPHLQFGVGSGQTRCSSSIQFLHGRCRWHTRRCLGGNLDEIGTMIGVDPTRGGHETPRRRRRGVGKRCRADHDGKERVQPFKPGLRQNRRREKDETDKDMSSRSCGGAGSIFGHVGREGSGVFPFGRFGRRLMAAMTLSHGPSGSIRARRDPR